MIYSSDIKNVSWQCVHYALPEQIGKIKDELRNSSLKFLECDVSSVKNDPDLFEVVSASLGFPDYFGNNWDAMDECLSDMEWLPADGYVLLLSSAEMLWKDATYTAGKLVSVWQAAAEQWGEEEVPFHLVFIL